MRNTCLDCVRKHLSQASVLMTEAVEGYPQHRWLAVGHMAEASAECCAKHPQLAARIRAERLKYMEDPRYKVPILDLIEEASRLNGELSGLSGILDEKPNWLLLGAVGLGVYLLLQARR